MAKRYLNGTILEDFSELSEIQQRYIIEKFRTNKSDIQIAKEIGVTNVSISRWKQKEKFRRGERAFNAGVLESYVPKALQTMMSLLEAKSELVRYQAAKDIMDRTGYTSIETIEFTDESTVTFIDDITAKLSGMKAEKEQGQKEDND